MMRTPKDARSSRPIALLKTMYNLVIDSNSCENIVSKDLIIPLTLKTKRRPEPYKISWI